MIAICSNICFCGAKMASYGVANGNHNHKGCPNGAKIFSIFTLKCPFFAK